MSDFKQGDRVRVEAPDNDWHDELATVIKRLDPHPRIVILRMDNTNLNRYGGGMAALSQTFLRLIEQEQTP